MTRECKKRSHYRHVCSRAEMELRPMAIDIYGYAYDCFEGGAQRIATIVTLKRRNLPAPRS